MTTPNRRILAATNGQLGLVTRRQAHAAGLTNDQLRSRVQSGTLQQSGTNTYRLPGTRIDVHSQLRNLLLDVGDDVWASGPTAAALHGFDGFALEAPFDVLIKRGRDVQRIGHRIHTTKALPLIDRSTVDSVRVTSGARTLIDLARREPHERLMIAFDSGLRDGKFSESLLHRRILALKSSGRFGIPKLLAAIDDHEIGAGGHSWLEREFLRIVASAGLPCPSTQQVLTRANDRKVRVDFHFPNTNVVVEVMGYRYHRSADQLARDAARMNALVAKGFVVYQFTYDMVTLEPQRVMAEVGAALHRAG